LDEIQGRFHYYRGCFWLENAVANGAVTVNGRALPAGSIVPLTTGMTLVLGNTQLRVGIGA
jgi:predicted component of type VI protein secretion system